MTQRSELQHRVLELKATLMAWVAGKIMTFRQTGMDGFIKRRVLPADSKRKTDSPT